MNSQTNPKYAVLALLDDLKISYSHYEHPPVHTMDDCLAIPGIDWADTEMPKNVFLCNRQQTAFYLMLLRHDVPFRTAIVSKALGVSRLSFAPDEKLPGLLGLSAGAVSPLGLPFDQNRLVTLAMDIGLQRFDQLAFHPCVNTATVVIRSCDFLNAFLKNITRRPIWVRAEEEALHEG